MSSKSFIYKVLVLLTAALVMNQIAACSKSSFEADEATKSQEQPEPESVDQDFFDTDDDDTGDTGLNNGDDDDDIYTYDDDDDPTPNNPSHPSCEILSNTGNCYRNVYNGNQGYDWYPLYAGSGSNRAIVDYDLVEVLGSSLNIQTFVNGTFVGHSETIHQNGYILVRPNTSGREIIIEFCTY